MLEIFLSSALEGGESSKSTSLATFEVGLLVSEGTAGTSSLTPKFLLEVAFSYFTVFCDYNEPAVGTDNYLELFSGYRLAEEAILLFKVFLFLIVPFLEVYCYTF